MQRSVAWSKDAPFGAEFVTVVLDANRLHAAGTAIGTAPEPYRLDYDLTTGADYVCERVLVAVAGNGWSRRLELARSSGGLWTAETSGSGQVDLPASGGESSLFGDALDPDLGLSPLFNTMPVLRHRIHEGGVADDFLMVWISVPDLSLHPSPQRYTHVDARGDDERLVRFEAVGGGFVADVVFDADGLVVDYPGIATRLSGNAAARE
jgi:hypothetical protein